MAVLTMHIGQELIFFPMISGNKIELHHVYRLCLEGDLCKTQLQHPQRVLDIGTGTGIWAIEGDIYALETSGDFNIRY
ncbi:hypothetical protein PENANT_c018G05782 [Penicillium antarcticum]|uniref:Methyltransferase domain-containing protein n=1 Tax=Penicillium antarcticum TaxID=416450 RepID=A0A1V6Q1I0_9EURO|nr:hypothetical protein PENANT_c018G05782 [Penicillium antarcticum]